MPTTQVMSDRRYVPLNISRIYSESWVSWCETCQSDTEHGNNNACGDPECCCPNYDFCCMCGDESASTR